MSVHFDIFQIINQQLYYIRRANMIGEDIKIHILLAYLRANPRVSIRNISTEIGFSNRLVKHLKKT